MIMANVLHEHTIGTAGIHHCHIQVLLHAPKFRYRCSYIGFRDKLQNFQVSAGIDKLVVLVPSFTRVEDDVKGLSRVTTNLDINLLTIEFSYNSRIHRSLNTHIYFIDTLSLSSLNAVTHILDLILTSGTQQKNL